METRAHPPLTRPAGPDYDPPTAPRQIKPAYALVGPALTIKTVERFTGCDQRALNGDPADFVTAIVGSDVKTACADADAQGSSGFIRLWRRFDG
jgi:hypothetical protein